MPKSKIASGLKRGPEARIVKIEKPISAETLEIQKGIQEIINRPLLFGNAHHRKNLGYALAAAVMFAPVVAALGANSNPSPAPKDSKPSNDKSATVNPPSSSSLKVNATSNSTTDATPNAHAGATPVKSKNLPHPNLNSSSKQKPKAEVSKKNKNKFKRKHQSKNAAAKNKPVKRELSERFENARNQFQETQKKLKLKEEQSQARFKAFVEEIKKHFLPEIINAFGGAENIAKLPLRRGTYKGHPYNQGNLGYNIPFNSVKDKVTLSILNNSAGYDEYYITLRYEVTERDGSKHFEIETFGQNGYSGGTRKGDNSGDRSVERVCMYRFTPRDTDYLRDLLAGKSVPDRMGSWHANKADIVSGRIKMEKGEEQEKKECLDTPPENSDCYFNRFIRQASIRLSDDLTPSASLNVEVPVSPKVDPGVIAPALDPEDSKAKRLKA